MMNGTHVPVPVRVVDALKKLCRALEESAQAYQALGLKTAQASRKGEPVAVVSQTKEGQRCEKADKELDEARRALEEMVREYGPEMFDL